MTVRRFAVLGIVLPLLCLLGCRDVSQPALDGTGPLFPVEQDDGWGYITRTGDLAIEPQFDRAYRFFQDRALVREDGEYGFIDTSGTFAIPPTFAAAGPFSGGLAPVRPDSLWGFVDRSGTMVVAPQFAMSTRGFVPDPDSTDVIQSAQRAGPPRFVPPETPPGYFSGNYARVRHNGEWGYLDRRGTVVISPQFSAASDFRNGLARVRLRTGEMAYITPSGTHVWPPAQ